MSEPVQEYARLLREQHQRREPFHPLPDASRNMAFAVAVQDASIAGWLEQERRIAGWKIGLTSQRMQQMCGVAEPVYGAIMADLLQGAHGRLEAQRYGRVGLEMEVAVRLKDVPAEGRPCTAETIRPLVDEIAAAFEIIDDRGADYARLDACSLVADNSWNQGIVRGDATVLEVNEPLIGRRGVLRRNGEEIASGMTEDAGGDPLAVVAWLVGALRQRGRELRPGDWVMTGSVIPTIFPQAGEIYRFEIDGLPPVEVDVR